MEKEHTIILIVGLIFVVLGIMASSNEEEDQSSIYRYLECEDSNPKAAKLALEYYCPEKLQ
jgi:hypothetical protein